MAVVRENKEIRGPPNKITFYRQSLCSLKEIELVKVDIEGRRFLRKISTNLKATCFLVLRSRYVM